MPAPAATKTYRFGVFELSLATRQLHKNGRELHLQEQPLRLLVYLLEQPGQLRSREELREKLWPTETFVEFDDGLNTAIQKIRQALNDDARNPRFVEKAPRRGYNFIAPVQVDNGPAPQPDHAAPINLELAPVSPAIDRPSRCYTAPALPCRAGSPGFDGTDRSLNT